MIGKEIRIVIQYMSPLMEIPEEERCKAQYVEPPRFVSLWTGVEYYRRGKRYDVFRRSETKIIYYRR